MTNEEKLYQIFPDGVCPFSRVWLSEEYKEPTNKNDLRVASGLKKNSKLEKIRDQLKSNLRGVDITLEVLVENDPLRPKMEGAKTTLEDCLELIEQAEAESI